MSFEVKSDDEKIFDKHGKFKGKFEDGRFFEPYGKYKGKITSKKEAYILPYGKFLGKIESNGKIYDPYGKYEEKIGNNKKIFDSNGILKGSISKIEFKYLFRHNIYMANISSLIWSSADDILRGLFKPSEYEGNSSFCCNEKT